MAHFGFMIQQWSKYCFFVVQIFLFVIFLLPATVYADGGYISLLGVPGLQTGSVDMTEFIETVMRMLIIAAALIAVIKIILAGAQYVLSGIVTTKEQAKADIRSALIGLLIILSAVVILRTINPSLANLPALKPAGDIIPWGDVLPPNPDQTTIDEICNEDSGGCTTDTCVSFNSWENLNWTVGWIPTVTGMDLLLNTVSCFTWCSWYGGKLTERDSLIPDSGVCTYPNNLEAYRAAQREALDTLARLGHEAEAIELIEFTPDSRFSAHMSNTRKLSDEIDGPDDVISMFEMTATEAAYYSVGEGELGEYEEEVLEKIINLTCIEQGGSKVIGFKSVVNGNRYYCI